MGGADRSARGIINRDALKLLRDRLPDITLVVDAGLGAPSHAAHALELGYDAVLLNTAIAKAADPVAMAGAFRPGVEAGRAAYEAGPDGSPRLRLPFHSSHRDTVLACRILIATRILIDSIRWSTASPGSRAWQRSASAPFSCAPRTSTTPRRCRLVSDALAAIKGTPAELVVNDYWRAAIVAGARHLHLGQEDLAEADLKRDPRRRSHARPFHP